MYTVTKRLEISAAHKLELDYKSKCQNLHGHNWIIEVTCVANELDSNGMVYDFTHIKREIVDRLDHQYINEVLGAKVNPTAENIAKWVCDTIGSKCVKVTVQESEGNVAAYERE